jgi:hypothetical protein
MPINESTGRIYSGLTPKEEHEAMREIYGLGDQRTMTPVANAVYEARIQALEAKIKELDPRQAAPGMKEFDLAKPPVPQYQFREFPFIMYHHQTRTSRAANSHEERERMRDDGWSDQPFRAQGYEEPLTRAEIEEAAKFDRRAQMSSAHLEFMDRISRMSKEDLETLLGAMRGGETQASAEPEPETKSRRSK